MITVYVAGPFRAISAWEVEQNIRRAEELALELWRCGFAVLCPHTNTRFFDGAAPNEVFLEGDLWLLRCCDCLITVEDWARSSGACGEVAQCVTDNTPVFHCIRKLIEARDAGLIKKKVLQ